MDKMHVKFTHPTGKWYLIAIKATSGERFAVTRVWGKKGSGRKAAKKFDLMTTAQIQAVVHTRIQHGYSRAV